MDRILIILKKENGPRASSALTLGIILKHVYWYTYMQQISGERLQDHWSSFFFVSTRSDASQPIVLLLIARVLHFGSKLKRHQAKLTL